MDERGPQHTTLEMTHVIKARVRPRLSGWGEQRVLVWCGRRRQSRRPCGTLHRWSGGETHATTQRGRRARRRTSLRLAVLGPAIPCLQGMGSGQCEVVRFTGMTRSLDEHLTEAGLL